MRFTKVRAHRGAAWGLCGHRAETQSHTECLCPALKEARGLARFDKSNGLQGVLPRSARRQSAASLGSKDSEESCPARLEGLGGELPRSARRTRRRAASLG
jgi:HEAT repeat protein